ncbi:hypothetical protein HAX54_010244 [Datura stramonium]|uniref:Uncharacterized protein n=1 Tax=Datura stramonium TaxID=4076 RepID=A0ABS8RXB8_DATST|nr:hypothetical protein [Datura stramonium]
MESLGVLSQRVEDSMRKIELEWNRHPKGVSSPGNSEAGLNQPAPDSPNPGEVGAAKRPDPEFSENGVLGTGQAEII